MPLAEIKVVKGHLSANQIKTLGGTITQTFMKHQRARPESAAAKSITCVEVTEIDSGMFFVGGEPAQDVRLRVVYTVPFGSLDEDAKASLVNETTRLVLSVQDRDWEEDGPYDIWCIINEVPDGNWGAAGRIFRWREIMRWVIKRDGAARRAERSHQA